MSHCSNLSFLTTFTQLSSFSNVIMKIQCALCCTLAWWIKSQLGAMLSVVSTATDTTLFSQNVGEKKHFETHNTQLSFSSSSWGPPKLNLHFGLYCLKALIVLQLQLIFQVKIIRREKWKGKAKETTSQTVRSKGKVENERFSWWCGFVNQCLAENWCRCWRSCGSDGDCIQES